MYDVIKVIIVNRFDCCGIYLKYFYFNIFLLYKKKFNWDWV